MTDLELKSLFASCRNLTAEQLDLLIGALGELRAQAEPAVPVAPDDLIPTTDAPALKAGVRADGRLEISIRSPAFGWQKFTLSDHNTAAIGEHFILTKPFWEKAQHLTVHKADGPPM